MIELVWRGILSKKGIEQTFSSWIWSKVCLRTCHLSSAITRTGTYDNLSIFELSFERKSRPGIKKHFGITVWWLVILSKFSLWTIVDELLCSCRYLALRKVGVKKLRLNMYRLVSHTTHLRAYIKYSGFWVQVLQQRICQFHRAYQVRL